MQPIIKKSLVRVVEGARPLGPNDADAAAAEEEPAEPVCEVPKEARLIRVDGEVRALEVRCSCGEITLIEIEYGESADSPEEESP